MNKLMYIQWEDHFGTAEMKWVKFEDDYDPEPLLIESVGWVVYENKKMICLLPHKYTDHDEVTCGQGEIFILKKCIKKKRTIKF